MLDLLQPVVNTLSDMALNTSGEWNRDTGSQAASFLKSVDFDFIINIVIARKMFAFVSGITTSLQTRGIDMGGVCNQVQLVIRVLKQTRSNVESFQLDCFEEACLLARNVDADIKKPRTCK